MVPQIQIHKADIPPTAGLDTYIRLQSHRVSMDHPGISRFEVSVERKASMSGLIHHTRLRAQWDGREISAAGASPDIFLSVRDAFIMLRMELPTRVRPAQPGAVRSA